MTSDDQFFFDYVSLFQIDFTDDIGAKNWLLRSLLPYPMT